MQDPIAPPLTPTPPSSPAKPVDTATPVPWKKLALAAEKTVLGAVSTFLGSVTVFSGGAWDAKHLEAAAIGAVIGAAYQLSGVISNYLQPS